MHFSENEELSVERFAHSPFANTQLVEEGEPWLALALFLRQSAVSGISDMGSESRFIQCAFCATVLAVNLRRMRGGKTVCKGMLHGWVPSATIGQPARPICKSLTCVEFAEFSQAMDCGQLIYLSDWAGGLGGYVEVGSPPAHKRGFPKKANRHGRQRK